MPTVKHRKFKNIIGFAIKRNRFTLEGYTQIIWTFQIHKHQWLVEF